MMQQFVTQDARLSAECSAYGSPDLKNAAAELAQTHAADGTGVRLAERLRSTTFVIPFDISAMRDKSTSTVEIARADLMKALPIKADDSRRASSAAGCYLLECRAAVTRIAGSGIVDNIFSLDVTHDNVSLSNAPPTFIVSAPRNESQKQSSEIDRVDRVQLPISPFIQNSGALVTLKKWIPAVDSPQKLQLFSSVHQTRSSISRGHADAEQKTSAIDMTFCREGRYQSALLAYADGLFNWTNEQRTDVDGRNQGEVALMQGLRCEGQLTRTFADPAQKAKVEAYAIDTLARDHKACGYLWNPDAGIAFTLQLHGEPAGPQDDDATDVLRSGSTGFVHVTVMCTFILVE